MMVGMAMRFRPLPSLMFVLMMFIVVVQVGVTLGSVLVLKSHRVMCVPDKGREPRCRQGHRSQPLGGASQEGATGQALVPFVERVRISHG